MIPLSTPEFVALLVALSVALGVVAGVLARLTAVYSRSRLTTTDKRQERRLKLIAGLDRKNLL